MFVLKYKGVIIGILFLAAVITGYFSLPEICDNSIFDEVISPDKELKIVVFERACGATTGFSTQISIIGNNDDIGNEAGNIYIGGEDRDGYATEWLSSSNVKIYGVDGKHYKKLFEFDGVSIVYE